jgi:hypothetical protein
MAHSIPRDPLQRNCIMSKNTKKTSGKIAALAADTLNDPDTSVIAKSLAASALAQRSTEKQTSAELEEKAGKVLQSDKYSEDTKSLAASVLSQANKERGR